MHILVMYQGHYGERILNNVKNSALPEWIVETISVPQALPHIIDDPGEFLPSDIPQADLLLALSESAEAAQLVTATVRLSGAKAVIMPIDSSAWLPPGLQNQIRNETNKEGVAAIFPKTFCTLTEENAGFGVDAESYKNEYISSFAVYFGWPRLTIEVDRHSGKIVGVKVERSAPCGSTHLVAEKLIGIPVEEAVPQAGLFAHVYPCLASMAREPNGETLMHISGYVVNDEVKRHIEPLL